MNSVFFSSLTDSLQTASTAARAAYRALVQQVITAGDDQKQLPNARTAAATIAAAGFTMGDFQKHLEIVQRAGGLRQRIAASAALESQRAALAGQRAAADAQLSAAQQAHADAVAVLDRQTLPLDTAARDASEAEQQLDRILPMLQAAGLA